MDSMKKNKCNVLVCSMDSLCVEQSLFSLNEMKKLKLCKTLRLNIYKVGHHVNMLNATKMCAEGNFFKNVYRY